MKLLRTAVVVAAAVLLALVVCGLLVYLNQERIVTRVLSGVEARSGVRIEPRASHLEFRNHLIVVLERPRVFLPDGETVSLKAIRAVLNYHSILVRRGLPIRNLVLDHPAVRLGATAAGLPGTAAYPEPATVRKAVADLGRVTLVARRVEAVGLSLSDASGRTLVDHVGLFAFRTRRQPLLWNVSVDSTVAYPPFRGARVAATFVAGSASSLSEHVVAKGHLWFWKVPIDGLVAGGLKASAEMHGSSGFSIRDDATLDGDAEVGLKELTLTGSGLSAPLDLGDYSLEAAFSTSPERISLSSATLRHGGQPMLAAEGQLQQPGAANPKLHVQVGGLKFDWHEILSPLRSIRDIPANLRIVMEHLKSASVTVGGASLQAPLDALARLSPEELLKHLTVSVSLSQASFAPPAETGLPPVSALDAQLNYSGGVLSASQGTAKMGNSSISDFSARLDLRQGLSTIPYSFSLKGDVDVGELKPAITARLGRLDVQGRERLEQVSGAARIGAMGSGVVGGAPSSAPVKYAVRIRPEALQLVVRGAPAPITLTSGSVVVTPGTIDFSKVVTQTTAGAAELNGSLTFEAGNVVTSGLAVDIHQLPAREWLALAIDEQTLVVQGSLGGHVVVTRKRGVPLTLDGKLTLGQGQVKFGFLKAPIVVQAATLTLQRRSLVLAMPDSRLQGHALNFKVAVRDWRHPALRIDAVAQRLDLGVMSFIRLPWLPPTNVRPFTIPVSGRVEAAHANLGRLTMSNMKGDFSYDGGNWRVNNFSAKSFKGDINLELSGRARDDWMHMVGKVRGMQVGPLFLLSGKRTQSPVVGRLDLDADLWADTDGDFFRTLAGTAAMKVRDGRLNRFTLLSRLLSLVNLKNWLTANVPDPRRAGLPFEAVVADFQGTRGVLYTDNLRLHGPVMDIVASGSVDVNDSNLDMVIGMLPLKTVNWLLSNIPIIGKNVAGGTSGLVAAYFHVTGPVSNPDVTPAPITSVEELVKKTLGLPINILAPDTIK